MLTFAFVLTLAFTDGRLERQPPRVFSQAHAKDHCRVAEAQAVEEVKQQIHQGLLKGYTLVACHPEVKE